MYDFSLEAVPGAFSRVASCASSGTAALALSMMLALLARAGALPTGVGLADDANSQNMSLLLDVSFSLLLLDALALHFT